MERYAALFISLGAGDPQRLAIEGENLEGIIQGLDLLREIKMAQIEDRTVQCQIGRGVEVIGGGNVAVDAATSAMRLGAEEVTIRYRRSDKEMPAWRDEIAFAQKEGGRLEFLCAPKRFLGDHGRLRGIEYIRMRLGEIDN